MIFEYRQSDRSGLVLVVAMFVMAAMSLLSTPARAQRLDEMSLERWAKLREVERYQLKIAEKYYRQKDWKIAMAEYEKFLTLYEQSEGAAYSQLKWSLCLVNLRKLNTAIKDGFQSVVDYWPDSPEAVAAGYYIGKSYKDMGGISPAKKAYQNVLSVHPKHLAAVYATVDLIDLSKIEDDTDARVVYWKRLTFETARTKESQRHCVEASRHLAKHLFGVGAFSNAVKALQTTYSEDQLGVHIHQFACEAMRRKLPQMDAGLSTLLKELSERGLLDSTIVWCCGEFGRTPKVDWQPPWDGGRHHYGKVFSAMIAGGGFKGGHVVGSSDAKGEEVKDRPVYPRDLIAGMYELLGIDLEGTMPNPQGPPVRVIPAVADGAKTGGRLTEIM